MKILFITPSYKPAFVYGGPTVSVSQLAEALTDEGQSVTVYTTTANGRKELDVTPGIATDLNGVKVIYFKRITGDHTHISPQLWKCLERNYKKFDVIHLHSWWSILIMEAARVCKQKGVPYILSPRGMLGSYSFTHQNNFLKRILHSLWGKRLLVNSILHATSEKEWKDCMQVHPQWKGFILPNVVALPDAVYKTQNREHPVMAIGFLSRIDPKKGLEYVFHALANVNFRYRFFIAGSGEENYIKSLRDLAVQLGIQEHIQWCGWMEGESKFQFLEQLDLFVLTSYNENFANAVVESLSVGCPVLVSRYVGLSDYVSEKKLGWVCDLDKDSIRTQLEMIHENRKMLNDISENAPHVVRYDFNKSTLARLYLNAYKSGLHLSEKILETV